MGIARAENSPSYVKIKRRSWWIGTIRPSEQVGAIQVLGAPEVMRITAATASSTEQSKVSSV
jgi:hypothetical protein